jgi:hypothetical protein
LISKPQLIEQMMHADFFQPSVSAVSIAMCSSINGG